LFSLENADLQFTEGALAAIAKRAKEKETGARGLRSIIEEIMLDIMYDLPEHQGARYIIDENVVLGRTRAFPHFETKSKSA
jgi:ATP-dependent Clp protease ATP-binding subunit ClpX